MCIYEQYPSLIVSSVYRKMYTSLHTSNVYIILVVFVIHSCYNVFWNLY